MADEAARVGWVDTAKGICIILVVMMHATLGVGEATGRTGWLHAVIAFAHPFRMPDFFLISGLFLGLVIDRPWLRYLDRKVVHFVYFYVLWLAIQFVFKAPEMVAEGGPAAPFGEFLFAFVQPFGTLWFVYLLPVFFVFTRLVRHLPAWFVLAWAAVLEILPVHTGSILFDEFCARYVFFLAGYLLAARIFDLARWVEARRARSLLLLAAWALVNGMLVFTPAPDGLAFLLQHDFTGQGNAGLAVLPVVSLLLGVAGTMAIVAVSAMVAKAPWSAGLNWLGAHSIVIYLAFFLPMAVSRAVLLRLGLFEDVGTVALLVTVAGMAGPVVLYGLVQWTGYGRFLFERPGWARIDRPAARPSATIQPAE